MQAGYDLFISFCVTFIIVFILFIQSFFYRKAYDICISPKYAYLLLYIINVFHSFFFILSLCNLIFFTRCLSQQKTPIKQNKTPIRPPIKTINSVVIFYLHDEIHLVHSYVCIDNLDTNKFLKIRKLLLRIILLLFLLF